MAAPGTRMTVRRTPARAAVATAVVGLLVIAAFGAYLRFGDSGPLAIDDWWQGIVSVTRGSGAYAIAVFLAEVGGSAGAAACVAIAAALFLAMRRRRDAAALVTAALLGVALSETVKALVVRPRPWGQLFESHGASYPSGHSMGAAAIAVSIVLVALGSERIDRRMTRWIAAAAVFWTLAMMWSRTALHVHWLSDTIAGALLGASAAIVARRLWFGPDRGARSEPARIGDRRNGPSYGR